WSKGVMERHVAPVRSEDPDADHVPATAPAAVHHAGIPDVGDQSAHGDRHRRAIRIGRGSYGEPDVRDCRARGFLTTTRSQDHTGDHTPEGSAPHPGDESHHETLRTWRKSVSLEPVAGHLPPLRHIVAGLAPQTKQ